jgi:fibro-slime domain-containing protein
MNATRSLLWTGVLVLVMGLPATAQNVLELTGTLRDFNDSHPDFENSYNWQFPLITGMVKATLGEDGKPELNASDAATLTQGEDSYGDAQVSCTFNSNGVSVAATCTLSYVKLYFTDGSSYRYSNLSAASGEFPIPSGYQSKTLDSVKVRVYPDGQRVSKIFNVSDAGAVGIPAQWRIASAESFGQWFANVEGVNQSTKHTIQLTELENQPGVYKFEASIHNGQSFFPLDDRLLGNQGRNHNYHFTYNIHTKFTYTNPSNRESMIFNFSGDDDVWVYINKKLVVDLGGVHSEKSAYVNVDSIASQIGLEVGKTYDFDFFFAERHTTQSNCTITTSIQFISPLYD